MRFICSHDEDSRCHRLLAVLRFVHELHADSGFDVFMIEALEDHKGILIVHWGDIEPTEERKTWFHVAWSVAGEEPYEMVEHAFAGHESNHSEKGVTLP